jgi:hypothetical protein
MKTVMLIDSVGPRYFQRLNGQWFIAPKPARDDQLWVLFDLPEETLEVIDMPRLFGNDRSSYIARRLNSTFQDSPYRAAHTLSGNLLKPGKVMLNGIGSAKDIDTALADLDTTLVGLWGCAALLSQVALKNVPPDVMLALPGKHQLRIVVMKNRIPVLIRCVQHDAESDAGEIQLTRQYLENQRITERGKPLPLLYLGDSSALGEGLSKAGIPLLYPPKAFAPKGEAGWMHILFEHLITSPPCQLAPLPLRARHLATNMRVLAYLGAVASVATALYLSESDVRELYDLQEREITIATDIQSATTERDRLAEIIKSSGADPELVRKAAQFELQEIKSAPGANDFLQIAAAAISKLPDLRINDLTFHASQDPSSSCNSTASGDNTGAQDMTDSSIRHAEIQFSIAMPADKSPSTISAMRKKIAASLASIKGVKVQKSPLNNSRSGVLKGGFSNVEETLEQWCVSIPWKNTSPDMAEKP